MAGDPDLGVGGVFVLINLINLANVKVFGEAEFWFAIIKVVAIVSMIAAKTTFLVSDGGEHGLGPIFLYEDMAASSTWCQRVGDGHGDYHVLLRQPGNARLHRCRSRPATHRDPPNSNQVIYRILIFYIGALVVLVR